MSEQSSTAVAIREADAVVAWTPRQLLAQVNLVQDVMREAMKAGEHYGVIPGTERKDKDGRDVSKPSLLQPGAQKLCMTFRLAPEYTVIQTDLANGHREYRTQTVLRSIQTGAIVGSGVGLCSTMESKYRWRKAERTCPSCGKPAIIKGKLEYGGGWLCFAKKGGCGAKYQDNDVSIVGQVVGQQENPDIADAYNTVLKMSKKRSFVDATIQALAVSDLFTQDLEDFHADEGSERQVQGGDGKAPEAASGGNGKKAAKTPDAVLPPGEEAISQVPRWEEAFFSAPNPEAYLAVWKSFTHQVTKLTVGERAHMFSAIMTHAPSADVVTVLAEKIEASKVYGALDGDAKQRFMVARDRRLQQFSGPAEAPEPQQENLL